MATVSLADIEMDTAIQCRAAIDVNTVNEYAERMVASDEFPPVDLFAANGRYWIGDGWHRVMGARQIGALTISANVSDGGRLAALKHALGANAAHGHRRSNADKRRAVEIAVREFSGMSSRAVAEMCGVGADLVISVRQLSDSDSSKTTGKDGKQRRARRASSEHRNKDPERDERPAETSAQATTQPKIAPSNGMQFARMAILDLAQITADDTERVEAFSTVRSWLNENQT